MSNRGGVRLIVSGFVQGVGYRYFAQREASRLGLAGYVRNLAGGDVEVYAEGEEEDISRLMEALRQGPGFSRVDEVVETRVRAGNKYKGFQIAY